MSHSQSADNAGHKREEPRPAPVSVGPALRRAWVGYQLRLDNAMTEAGFGDRGFPDGRVLRMCQNRETTISQIGRALGITRQGASKIVNSLRERGYVAVDPSPHSAREKAVTLTPRALEYLAAQRKASQAIDRRLRKVLGQDGFVALGRLLDELGADDQVRLRDYLTQKNIRDV